MSQNPQQSPQSQTRRNRLDFNQRNVLLTTIATVVLAIVALATFVSQIHPFGVGNTVQTSSNPTVTPLSANASRCPFGTLQTPTDIQTKVEDVPKGSALVVTLPTANDAQNVILLANHSDLDQYVCRHDLARFGASHKGPELLVLSQESMSSVDLILYKGSPSIEVVPNTQAASEINSFKQSYANGYVYEETNHALSTPNQQTIP